MEELGQVTIVKAKVMLREENSDSGVRSDLYRGPTAYNYKYTQPMWPFENCQFASMR
jgi:hypothetical protein